MRAIFRCDASLLIGSGHVMRCRILARQLKMQGFEIIFICRELSGSLIHLLQNEFRVLRLPPLELSDVSGLEGRELYMSWLGCSPSQDVYDCLTAMSSSSVDSFDWLIIDHYGIDAFWTNSLLDGLSASSRRPKLLVIDDLADRQHNADILLDPNFYGNLSNSRYLQLLPVSSLQLLGPFYALLGSEYYYLHSLVPFRSEVRRILIFFGGVDFDGHTAMSLNHLSLSKYSHIAVDVVLGSQSPHLDSVCELVDNRPNTHLYQSLPSLAGLIARADLSIGGCGSTSWERICLKLPAIVIPQAANQFLSATYLSEQRVIKSIFADFNSYSLEGCLDSALSHEGLASFYESSNLFNIVSGRGCLEVVSCMLNHS